jgi:hypothetical protein
MVSSQLLGGLANGNAGSDVNGFGSVAIPKPCGHALPHALLTSGGAVSDPTPVANGVTDSSQEGVA